MDHWKVFFNHNDTVSMANIWVETLDDMLEAAKHYEKDGRHAFIYIKVGHEDDDEE